eukprot:7110335-Prymnesium_polylepis.1
MQAASPPCNRARPALLIAPLQRQRATDVLDARGRRSSDPSALAHDEQPKPIAARKAVTVAIAAPNAPASAEQGSGAVGVTVTAPKAAAASQLGPVEHACGLAA